MRQIITIHLNPPREIMKIYQGRVRPHINLVYPFEIKDQEKLEEHIKNSIKNSSSFILTMKGLKKSAKEYYLYLLVDKGRKEILKLYKKLNSGILSDFKNPDMPKYIPHMTLKIFKSKKEIDKAYNNLKIKKLNFTEDIRKIDLVTLNKNNSPRKIKSFQLT